MQISSQSKAAAFSAHMVNSMLNEYQPDLVVSVHPLMQQFPLHLKHRIRSGLGLFAFQLTVHSRLSQAWAAQTLVTFGAPLRWHMGSGTLLCAPAAAPLHCQQCLRHCCAALPDC